MTLYSLRQEGGRVMLVQNSSSTKFKAHYQELSLVKKIKISNCGPTSPPHQLSTVSVSYIQRISRFLDAIASLVLTYDDDLDINDNININEYLDIDDDFDIDIEDNINLKTMKSLNIV